MYIKTTYCVWSSDQQAVPGPPVPGLRWLDPRQGAVHPQVSRRAAGLEGKDGRGGTRKPALSVAGRWWSQKVWPHQSVWLVSLCDACKSACNCLIGLVVKVSALGVEYSEFESCLRRGDFSGSSHTSDLKIGTQVATLPGAWRHRVSAGTGFARCQYIVTGWGRKFDLQLLSQCDST